MRYFKFESFNEWFNCICQLCAAFKTLCLQIFLKLVNDNPELKKKMLYHKV